MAHQSGLSLSTIQKFEGGSLESPTGLTKGKLATAYGVEVEQIDAYIESCAETSPQAA
jgi:transcriptional regulator with XRE-family HTH domain